MKQEPFFSVLIPVYGTDRFLPDCLDSVFAQTETDFEVICVNDASPDNAAETLKKYQKKYPTLRVITFRQNKGVSAARNTALKHARGRYVYFLDSDDLIKPSLFKTVRSRLEKTPLDCLICAAQPISENGQNKRGSSLWRMDFMPRTLLKKQLTYHDFLDHPAIIPGNPSFVFHRRAFLNQHHIKFPNIRFEDLVFQTAVFFNDAKFALLKKPLVKYRIHSTSMFQSGDKRFFDVFESCRLREAIIAPKMTPAVRQWWLNSKYILLHNLTYCIKKTQRAAFKKQIRQVMINDRLTQTDRSHLCTLARLFYNRIRPSMPLKIINFVIKLVCFILFLPVLIYRLHCAYRQTTKQTKKQGYHRHSGLF